MSRRFILAAVAVALWPSATAADPISVVIQRNVRASLFVADGMPGEEETQRDLDFLFASVSRTMPDRTVVTAAAGLRSDISDPMYLSANGSGSAFFETANLGGETSAASSFAALFTLDSPHFFNFAGTFTIIGPRAFWSAQLVETEGGGDAFRHTSGPDDGRPPGSFVPLAEAGLLQAGRWLLFVNTGGSAVGFQPVGARSSGGEFHLAFNLVDAAAVPEPASMLLVGSGLLGLVHAARRRRRTN